MKDKWDNIFRLHKDMEKVMIHNCCGGWVGYVEFSMKVILRCFKCGNFMDVYPIVNGNLKWHYEWKPKLEVKQFYGG